MTKQPSLYTIPPDQPFARELVRGILEQDGLDPAKLGQRLILLPTRRACRTVRDEFLRETQGKPLLLPRLQPLGDIDADELALSAGPQFDLTIPPGISPIRRQLLLSRLIAAREGDRLQMDRHLPLARTLARLMDQIYTEDLNLADLPHLVDSAEFAHHWQITVDFLSILSQHWPKILESEGFIDAADRRNRLINALAAYWEAAPPAYPIIAAGTTGSIPATARLLDVIARMPQGAVILPGLDQIIEEDAWNYIEEGHPQATLKRLLHSMDCTRDAVRPWQPAAQTLASPSARLKLASELMRPSASAHQWQSLHWAPADIQQAVRGLHLIEAETAQDEAEQIALLLRETLEEEGKTAVVITPDRALAARVAASMEKWGVQLDDSSGQPLIHTPAAQFFLLLADMCLHDLKPSLLLAVLKHPLCAGLFSPGLVARMEKGLLRGLTPPPGPQGLTDWLAQKLSDPKERIKPDAALSEDIQTLSDILSPFYVLLQQEDISLPETLETHLTLADSLALPSVLWRGDDGQTLAGFLTQLHTHIQDLPETSPRDYLLMLKELMGALSIRPAYGTHPRLAIMGQLEARMIDADRLILAGLNESTWPPDAGTDPFLSRPMKRDFGLPAPERAISLAAHDFVQGFCASDVYLTRSKKTDGAPTLPARWLYRLETVLSALGTSIDNIRYTGTHHWSEAVHHVTDIASINRPAPKPDPAIRPRKLSVTQIETWLKDPYSIYAKEILGLRKLEPLEKEPDAAARGTLIHAILEQFVQETAQKPTLPPNAEALFLSIAHKELPRHIPAEADRALIWPRLVRLAEWVITQENNWRQNAAPGVREATARWAIQPGLYPFTLSGIADRIDHLKEGGYALIDYKSGGASLYTAGAIKAGKLPQLPLEALMVREGAFAPNGIPAGKTGTLSYWIVSGGKKPGEVKELANQEDIDTAVSIVEAALYELIKTYEQPQTPYFALPVLSRAPRYNDYAHLSRVQEWTALDEAEDAV